MANRRETPVTSDANSPLPDEFAFIRRHFKQLAGAEALGLTDDAALFTPKSGHDMVVATDTMVEGVHFLPDDPPETLGRKLLRVNLSDIAAMGAQPFGWLLALACPRGPGHIARDDAWYAAFAAGVAEDQARFGVTLLGGDTTSTRGPLVMSLTILGNVAPGAALRRNGARHGDGLWVTGTIGDGALGLLALRGEIPDPDGWLADRYRLPQPRLSLMLSGVANAAMDVSDGLVQDAGHLARESGVGVVIDADSIPLSAAARASGAAAGRFTGENLTTFCATGGDDYELLLAVPDSASERLLESCRLTGTPISRIGRFDSGVSGARLARADGSDIPLERHGWSHM